MYRETEESDDESETETETDRESEVIVDRERIWDNGIIKALNE